MTGAVESLVADQRPDIVLAEPVGNDMPDLEDRTINAFPIDSIPADQVSPRDPASVRFRSIAEILLLRSIRSVAADPLLGGRSDITGHERQCARGGRDITLEFFSEMTVRHGARTAVTVRPEFSVDAKSK